MAAGPTTPSGAAEDARAAMPLATPWQLRLHKRDPAARLGVASIDVGTIDSVERFWRVVNHTPKPSDTCLSDGVLAADGHAPVSSMTLFAEGERPEWELYGERGGCTVSVCMPAPAADAAWLEVMMACAGNCTPACEASGMRVVGVRAVHRAGGPRGRKAVLRIEAWVVQATPRNVERVKRWMREVARRDATDAGSPAVEARWHSQQITGSSSQKPRGGGARGARGGRARARAGVPG